VPRPGLVGFAGRLADPRKNIGALGQAVARARESGIDCRAVLVGGEPDPATRAMAGRLGLADLIRFPGEVDRTRLREFYRDLDVFVIPSHQEGLCIAGVEAMACGVPVVSTRCGGPEDFVRPDQTGFLVDPTPDAIAAGIVRIVGDRSLRARLSANARALVERDYSPAAFHGRIGAAWKAVWNEDL
ncbi:MAG: glycosyltransferase family 4 protein, partial [Pseudomonadota bacterium]